MTDQPDPQASPDRPGDVAHDQARPVKRKGPTFLRDKQVDLSTTDQRLLDSRGASDWVHTDPWRVLRIQAAFVGGFGALAELGPASAVFGRPRTPRDAPAYAQGVGLARAPRREGFAHRSYGSLRADGVIAGLGTEGYEAAVRRVCTLVRAVRDA